MTRKLYWILTCLWVIIVIGLGAESLYFWLIPIIGPIPEFIIAIIFGVVMGWLWGNITNRNGWYKLL